MKYLDQKGQMNSYPLDIALDSNDHELKKKLNYIPEILKHIHKHEK